MLEDFVKKTVTWFGQCSLLFEYNNLKIFIDPFNLPKDIEKKADLILITHSHFDHLSLDDINLIADKNTTFYAPSDSVQKIMENGYKNVNLVEPYQKFYFKSVNIQTVPMYNVAKTKFHPKENKWVGYILDFDNIKVYVSGDTERIPEMKKITADICFLPLGQTYTMNSVEEAVDAVFDLKAKLAIPIHYGMYEGSKEDAKKFESLLKNKNINCLILD